MRYPNFVGSTTRAQSPVASPCLTRNWYLEPNPVGSWAAASLYPVPGQRLLATVNQTGARGFFSENGRTFAAIGALLYEETAANVWTERGSITAGMGRVTISSNGAGVLFITASGDGFTYTLSTNTIAKVLTGEASSGAAVDAYFLAFNRATGIVRVSGPNDGTFPDPLAKFTRSAEPDPLVAMVVDGSRQIWLIGEKTGEVWSDTGAYPVPFELAAGSVFAHGTNAPESLAVLGDGVLWLEQTKDGPGGVVLARGYSPEKVSSWTIDATLGALRRAGVTLSDAYALTMTDDGHAFYVLTLPTAGLTLAYDGSTNEWHTRSSWNAQTATEGAWRPSAAGYSNGRTLVGDAHSGQIAQLDPLVGTEADGRAIRRERIPPALWAANEDVTVDRFEAVFEPGLGAATGQGVDPQAGLEVSINGGKTWSSQMTASVGAQGQYLKRAFWLMCGSGPQWTPRLVCTDPIPYRVLEAVVEASGVRPTGRGSA